MEKQTVLRFCKRLKPSGGAGRAAAVQATKCPPDRTLPPFRQMQTAPAAPHAPAPRPPTARATVRRLTHRQPTAVADPRLQTEKGPIPVRRGSIAGCKDRIQPYPVRRVPRQWGTDRKYPLILSEVGKSRRRRQRDTRSHTHRGVASGSNAPTDGRTFSTSLCRLIGRHYLCR